MEEHIEWKTFPNLSRYRIYPNSEVLNMKTNKIVKPSIFDNKQIFSLYDDTNKKRTFTLHKLVATLFVPNPNNYKMIRHNDGNKLNNYASNLEWVKNVSKESLLTDEQKSEIKKLKGSNRTLARLFNSSEETVRRIRSKPKVKMNFPASKLTYNQIQRIKEVNIDENVLAYFLCVSPEQIRQIKNSI
ncbi:MAG TPA: hypothetical protein VIH86_13865 [Puia sp.]